MNRLLLLCVGAFLLAASLEAQPLRAQLEVNLGPIAIDSYDGASQNSYSGVTSGPNIPACSYGAGSNYRTCVQSILNSYSQQGVSGVRVYFGMNGDAGSTPFIDQAGDLSATWKSNFSLLLQDLRAANLRYVSFTPVWGTFGPGIISIYACISTNGPPYTYNFGCTSANANAVFYPWLPWALTYTPANPPGTPFASQGGPYDEFSNFAFDNAPRLGDPRAPQNSPRPWLWSSDPKSGSPLFNFFDFVFGAVAGAQLSVREFDIYPEVPMHASSLYGRLTYDPVQLVAPMGVINQIMQLHGLTPAAALSTAAFQPQNDQYCSSPYQNYVNSGLVLDEFLLLSASASGSFGRLYPDSQNHYCGTIDPTDLISGLPNAGLPLVDVHAYPADYVTDTGWGWIPVPNLNAPQYYPDGAPITNSPNGCAGVGCTHNSSYDFDTGNTSGTSVQAANMIYSAISGFTSFWHLPVPVIIGETDEYNPGGVGRDGINFPSMTEGSDCTTYGPYGSILFDTYTDPGTGAVHNVNFWCTPDWRWHRPWSTSSAVENMAGFSFSGLNQSNTIVRPWAPVSWGTVLSPAPLSGSSDRPYNIGGCSYPTNIGPIVVAADATSKSINVGPVSSACWWSTGPTPVAGSGPAYPSWFTLMSPAWQQGTGQVSASLAPNTSGSARSFQLTIAGNNVTFTQSTVLTPTPLTPANGASGVGLSPSLNWTMSSGATGYVLYLGTTSGNIPAVATLDGANSTSYNAGPLQPGTTYYWQVIATNASGSVASSIFSFSTQTSAVRAVFRDASGGIQMSSYASSVLSSAGGVFASDPSVAEDASGNVFVVARDNFGSIWANVFTAGNSTWGSWKASGGNLQGVPSIAVDSSGMAWIAVQDGYTSYWLVSFSNAEVFGTWTPLAGLFSTDPVITACADGSVYLIGKDTFNSLWSGHSIPGQGFQGWKFGGGIIKGKPSATCGGDNAVYVAAEDNFNSNWVARVAGNAWTGWFYGGAITSVPPRIAALGNGSEALVILDSTNVVWRTTFAEGTGNGWQQWTQVGGILQDLAPAASDGQLYFVGKAPNGDLWWWLQTGGQWTWIGNGAVGAGGLSATPK